MKEREIERFCELCVGDHYHHTVYSAALRRLYSIGEKELVYRHEDITSRGLWQEGDSKHGDGEPVLYSEVQSIRLSGFDGERRSRRSGHGDKKKWPILLPWNE